MSCRLLVDLIQCYIISSSFCQYIAISHVQINFNATAVQSIKMNDCQQCQWAGFRIGNTVNTMRSWECETFSNCSWLLGVTKNSLLSFSWQLTAKLLALPSPLHTMPACIRTKVHRVCTCIIIPLIILWGASKACDHWSLPANGLSSPSLWYLAPGCTTKPSP